MKIKDIKRHLSKYSIFEKRKTTINHAFASAIAPSDEYNEELIRDAIRIFKQDPDRDLFCVYCGNAAETWDHIFGLVKDQQFSGYGHVVGNLIPCCKKCNSEKGNSNFLDFLNKKIKDEDQKKEILEMIKMHLKKYLPKELNYEKIKQICPNETSDYEKLKFKIWDLMKEADVLATKIRQKIK